MSKLYIGNLPAEANEAALRQLLQEHAINVSSVLVKRGGYAFIDCSEQATIDRAIEKLNGTSTLYHSPPPFSILPLPIPPLLRSIAFPCSLDLGRYYLVQYT